MQEHCLPSRKHLHVVSSLELYRFRSNPLNMGTGIDVVVRFSQ